MTYHDPTGVSGPTTKRRQGKPTVPGYFARLMKTRHKRASRSLGYALSLGTSDGWCQFSAIARARLSEAERAGLAYAALRALPPGLGQRIAEAAPSMFARGRT